MKKRDIIIISILFIGTMLLAVHITCMALINRSPFAILTKPLHTKKEFNFSKDCNAGNNLDNIQEINDPHINKLVSYQEVCGGMPAKRAMIFTDMPNSSVNAKDKAKRMAQTLKNFSRVQLPPLVIMEPVTTWGDIDFNEYRTGYYDAWVDDYFKALKGEGITDQEMGIWTPFPEANLPYWNHQNSKPDDFAANVTRTIKIQKKYFPNSKASVMLNSATYENDDFDWRNGDYSSLLPYVKDIPKGLIDSFGFQGLPWLPPANQSGTGVVDAGEYLNPKLAKEAADQLGVKSIWINTGTFGKKYTLDQNKTIEVAPEQRKDLLLGVLIQAKKLHEQGYEVSVNLFSQDKSKTKEATDWSYWAEDPKLSPATSVFTDFARELKQNNMALWLFDRDN